METRLVAQYVNRGPDPRILGPVGGWVQSKLSFHSDTPPKGVTLIGEKNAGHLAFTWPPFVSVFVSTGNGRYASFRAGWRHDHNWPGFVADIIVKLRIDKVVSPY